MTQRDSNPCPLRCRCSALTNWAMKSHSGEQVNLLGSCFPVKGMSYERMLYAVRCLKSNEDMILALAGQFKQLSHEPEKWVRIPLSHLNFSGSWDNCLNCPASARIISSFDIKFVWNLHFAQSFFHQYCWNTKTFRIKFSIIKYTCKLSTNFVRCSFSVADSLTQIHLSQ